MHTDSLLLYYALRPLADAATVRLWQSELCLRLGLHGRVVVSPQGLRGTVGGPPAALEEYARTTREHPAFARMPFTAGVGQPRRRADLSVVLKEEIVAFGAPGELAIGADGLLDVGRRLTAAQVHRLRAERGEDVVLFDGRNRYEAEIGRLKGAVLPDVRTARELLAQLDHGCWDGLKSRTVVPYCVAGVRSEVLAGLMTRRGFTDVRPMAGGILEYGRVFGDTGWWQGSLYVLDDRVQISFGPGASVLGRCESCGTPSDSYRDCLAPLCRNWALLCNGCADFALCAAHRN